MKFGEKLQKLRKQSGLSQEQLAAQLTVSRQAVSKWELDDTMPDTENVIQLGRIFSVSCDYLLRDEVDELGAALAVQDLPLPVPPVESHLNEDGWTHNAFVFSLGVCAIGLVTGYMGLLSFHSRRLMAAGLIVQLIGLVLFELAAPRMGNGRGEARLNFYAAACWLVLPLLLFLGFSLVLDDLIGWRPTVLRAISCYMSAYLLLAAAVTAVLLFLRRRARAKA